MRIDREIPASWRIVTLGEVLAVLKNGNAKKQNLAGEGVPVTRIETISLGLINPKKVGYSTEFTEDDKRKYLLFKDDILLSHINSEPLLGNTAIVGEGELYHGMNLLLLRAVKDVIVPSFLHYLLQHYRNEHVFISISARAVGQSSINQGRLKALEIPLPPLSEQQAITEVLSTVQHVREAVANLIAAARELKKSMMQHLFTYGPVPLDVAAGVPLKETEIGMVPKNWETLRLGAVIIKSTESIHPKKISGTCYVGLEHITPYDLSVRVFGNSDETKSEKNVFKMGDILYGKLRPYLNKVALMDVSGVCSTDILVLRNNEKSNAGFMAQLMHSEPFLTFSSSTMTGVNHPRTSWERLKTLTIGLPNLTVQIEIAAQLDSIDQKITAETARHTALEALFQSLLSRLMRGELRVGIR